jgi:hypothetical protein
LHSCLYSSKWSSTHLCSRHWQLHLDVGINPRIVWMQRCETQEHLQLPKVDGAV